MSKSHLDGVSTVVDTYSDKKAASPEAYRPLCAWSSSLFMSKRNILVACCGLSLVLFFFPLQVVVDSTTGQQQSVLNLTGYDAVLRLVDSLNTSDGATAARPPDAWSLLMADWVTPLAFLAAFVFAGTALIAAAKNKRVGVLCAFGLCCSILGILYTGNLAISAKTAEPLPPPGLARDIMADIVRHVEKSLRVEPGWAAYALAALLGLAIIVSFSQDRRDLDNQVANI